MSKSSSTDIFHLIKSLSGTERGYFKNFVTSKKDNEGRGYAQLFDAIDKQKAYDEKLLLLNGKPIRNLPLLKNRLYTSILSSLEQYHSGNSIDAKLKSFIRQIEVLFQKGLVGQCSRLILKTKKIAEENESFEAMIDIYSWERLVLDTNFKSTAYEIEKNKFYEEVSSTLDKLKNHYDYLKIQSGVNAFMGTENSIRNKATIKKIDMVLRHPLMLNENKILSQRTKWVFWSVQIKTLQLQGELIKAYNFSAKFIQQPPLNKNIQGIRGYFNRLHQHATICDNLNKSIETEITIGKMLSMIEQYNIKKSHFLFARIHMSCYDLRLSHMIDLGEFKAAQKFLVESQELFLELQDKIYVANKIVSLYNYFYIYFGVGDYHKSLDWLNKTIEICGKTGLRTDIYSISMLMKVIVHFELNNTDSLPYVLKSTYRHLSKRKLVYKFEKITLDFIRLKLPKVNTKKEQVQGFADFKKLFEEIIKDPMEKKVLRYFDFISWLESKIEKRSFAEIIREKAYRGNS